MSDLNGKVALVSGAARGIGAAIAQTMVDHGAKVVIGDVLDGEGQRWPRRSARRRRTPTSTSRAPTTGRQPSQRRSTGTASSTWLVNNAGIAGAAPIDQDSLADWEKIVAVNLTETNVPTWISTPNPDSSAAVRR